MNITTKTITIPKQQSFVDIVNDLKKSAKNGLPSVLELHSDGTRPNLINNITPIKTDLSNAVPYCDEGGVLIEGATVVPLPLKLPHPETLFVRKCVHPDGQVVVYAVHSTQFEDGSMVHNLFLCMSGMWVTFPKPIVSHDGLTFEHPSYGSVDTLIFMLVVESILEKLYVKNEFETHAAVNDAVQKKRIKKGKQPLPEIRVFGQAKRQSNGIGISRGKGKPKAPSNVRGFYRRRPHTDEKNVWVKAHTRGGGTKRTPVHVAAQTKKTIH